LEKLIFKYTSCLVVKNNYTICNLPLIIFVDMPKIFPIFALIIFYKKLFMKHLYIPAVFLMGTLIFSAQESKVVWQKNIPSSTQDFLSEMTSTIDGQILLSGSSIQNQKQNGGYDYHVVKFDQQGNKIWDKHFGGTRHDYLMSSVATREGGFLLSGTSYSNQSGDKKENNLGGSDVWIIRLDENGEELWQKTLGTKSNDEASSVVQSMDEGFFVAGSINSNKQLFGSKDVFVSKLDKNGNLKQTIILGGSGLDEVTDMIPTKDGGAVLAMYSTNVQGLMFKVQGLEEGLAKGLNSNHSDKAADLLSLMNSTAQDSMLRNAQPESQAKNLESFGSGDYWVVKLDKNADVEWQKTFGGKEDDRPKNIVSTENGYLISGESRSNSSGNKRENSKEGTDIWVIYADKNGEELWQESYSFGNRDVAMSLDVVKEASKKSQEESGVKGFLIGGYTQAEEKMKSDDEKFWMLYIDQNGKEVWRKYVEGKEKKKEERLVSARLQRDGSYLLAGTSADELGKEQWKIVKLGDRDLENLIEKQDLRIYPNPVEDYCYVEVDTDVEAKTDIEISVFDMSGKQIQTLNTKNKVTKINTANLPQGIYIVSAVAGANKKSGKIVKK
jgi:hypothetical protein